MAKNGGDDETFGTWRRETLATYITNLQNQITRMEEHWDTIRLESMSQSVFVQVSNSVDESMKTGLDVLDKADRFMMERTRNVPPPAEPLQDGGAQARPGVGAEIPEGGGGGKMDNTLRPTDKLTCP